MRDYYKIRAFPTNYMIGHRRMSLRARRAAGRAACWQVADEHTSPGRGRAGTDAPQGHGEMLLSPVKMSCVVGFKKQGQC